MLAALEEVLVELLADEHGVDAPEPLQPGDQQGPEDGGLDQGRLEQLPAEPEVEPERAAPPAVDPNADTAVHSVCPTTICEVSVHAARA